MSETKEAKTTAPVLIGKHHDITAFCSSDSTRYVLQGVHYDAEHRRIEATDGKMLIRVPVATNTEEFPPVKAGDATLRDCIVPMVAFKKALGNIPAKVSSSLPVLNYARLSANGDGKATLVTTDLDTEQAVTGKCIEGNYPDLQNPYPTAKPILTVHLGSKLLKRIAEYAERHGAKEGEGGVHIKFSFVDAMSPVRFEFKLDDAMGEKPVAEGLLCPVRVG